MSDLLEESELLAEWRRLQKLHGSDLVDLHREIENTPNALRRQAFQTLLLSHWASMDPEGALAFYSEEEDRLQIMWEWLKSDADPVVGALLEQSELAPELLPQIARVAPSRLAD